MSTDSKYSSFELRQMDRDEAKQTLTVVEFERWEKLQELRDGAEQTRERFEAEDEQVSDIVVNADMDALGTSVDVYGNDLLVRANPDDSDLRDAADRLEGILDGHETDEVPDLDDGTRERLADAAVDMISALLLRWDGTEWDALGEDTRADVLAQVRQKWGIDGLVSGIMEIMAEINREQEERADVVESFRKPERRGNR